jgi:hypothetical protein
MLNETKIAISTPTPTRAKNRFLGEQDVGTFALRRALARSQMARGKQAQAGKFHGGT